MRRRLPVLVAASLRGNMRRHARRAQLANVLSAVIRLVLACSNAMADLLSHRTQHFLRSAAFGRAAGLGDHASYRQAVPVLHHDMPHVRKFRLAPVRLAIEAAIRIRGGVRAVLALLAMEVRAVAAAAIFGTEALLRSLRWPFTKLRLAEPWASSAHASISVHPRRSAHPKEAA